MNRRLIRGFALVILFLVGVVGTRGYVTSFFFFFGYQLFVSFSLLFQNLFRLFNHYLPDLSGIFVIFIQFE